MGLGKVYTIVCEGILPSKIIFRLSCVVEARVVGAAFALLIIVRQGFCLVLAGTAAVQIVLCHGTVVTFRCENSALLNGEHI